MRVARLADHEGPPGSGVPRSGGSPADLQRALGAPPPARATAGALGVLAGSLPAAVEPVSPAAVTAAAAALAAATPGRLVGSVVGPTPAGVPDSPAGA